MNVVSRIFAAFWDVPDYVRGQLLTKYLVPTIIVALIYLIILFFSTKVVNILRNIYIVAAVAIGVIAYFRHNYALIWLCVLSLVILGVVKLIRHIFVTVQQNRINARIEAKALAKARKRRGSWHNKQGYSGEAKPIIDPDDLSDEKDEDTSSESASDEADRLVLDESIHESLNSSDEGEASDSSDSSIPMNRRQIMDAIMQLKELKDKGVLTEEEFNKKKTDLYEKMG